MNKLKHLKEIKENLNESDDYYYEDSIERRISKATRALDSLLNLLIEETQFAEELHDD